MRIVKLLLVLRAVYMAAVMTLTVVSVAQAHDCSSPGDCEQTAGYNGALAVTGAVIAIGTAIIASGFGASAGAAAGGGGFVPEGAEVTEGGGEGPEGTETEPEEGEPEEGPPGEYPPSPPTEIIDGPAANETLINAGMPTITIDGQTFIVPPAYPDSWPPGIHGGAWTTTHITDPATGQTIDVIPPGGATIIRDVPPAPEVPPPVAPPEAAPPETPGEVVPPEVVTPPEVAPPEVAPPEVAPPEVSPPEVAPPEVAPPEVAPPEVAPPEVAPPEVAPPEVAPPEVAPPEVAPPEVPPEVVPPEVTPPETPPEIVIPPPPVVIQPDGFEQPEPPEDETPPEEPEEEPAPPVDGAKNFDDACEGKVDAANPPETITLPGDLSQSMSDSWNDSFPNDKSQEHGGTIVKHPDGTYGVDNEGAGTSGTFSPDYTTEGGDAAKGAFHSHPYDTSEGGYTDVNFSDGDFSHFIAAKNNVHGVQSGSGQFVMVRTNNTPAQVNEADVAKTWNDAFDAAKANGKSFQDACNDAANKTADSLNIKIYRGQGGQLNLQN